jgi:diguanylate cyclase (GGDEF)-like protein
VDAQGDPGYLRFRRNTVKLAYAASVIAAAMIAAYALATWGLHPHRAALVAIAATVWVLVAAMYALRIERLVETRWCDVFFGVWSAFYVVVIAAISMLDGAGSSPLLITFFAPLVFAGTCYPLRLAVYVGVTVLTAHVAIGVGAAGDDPDDLAESLYVTGMLALTAVMCSWQAYSLEGQRRELALASRTDHLTGMLNRRGFHERAEGELARAARSGDDVALVLVDLDGFKRVNDAHGHAAGDALLCWVSDRLRAGLRPSDAAGRLGGDEFALLLPGLDAVAAREVAERLRAVLAERTGASFGTAGFPSQPDVDSLTADADADLYREKPRGRGQDEFELSLEIAERAWY